MDAQPSDPDQATSSRAHAEILVSVVIPAFNASRFIARALDSALAQDIPMSEIIVVDDGSSDDTRELVASYEKRGVRLIRHAARKGAAAARNTGIAQSSGTYVAFLDADDEWHHTKLRKQLDVISHQPDMTFISCQSTLVDEHGRDHGDIYRGAPPAHGREAWRTLLTYPCVATPSVLARRRALLAAGPFNRWLPVGEDQDMWIRLSLIGDVGHLPEPLVRVHSTPNSLSKTTFREQAGYVLPMISTYAARLDTRLTSDEKRKILGNRLSKIGRSAYANGEWTFGVVTILRAIAQGHKPIRNVAFLIRASGLVRWLKRLLHRMGALHQRVNSGDADAI